MLFLIFLILYCFFFVLLSMILTRTAHMTHNMVSTSTQHAPASAFLRLGADLLTSVSPRFRGQGEAPFKSEEIVIGLQLVPVSIFNWN